jgi:hypothetical protein
MESGGKHRLRTVNLILTKQYLTETDPMLKRYYYCHCPWAREAVKNSEKVAPIFFNCSSGFHKKPGTVLLVKRSKSKCYNRCYRAIRNAACHSSAGDGD